MFRLFLFVVVVIVGTARLNADEGKREVSVFLGRDLLSPHLVRREVQSFTAARVPTMPAVKSVAEWNERAARMRAEVLDRVVFRGEAAASWRKAKSDVQWLDTLPAGVGYRIKKLRYEALPGVWIPALLYELLNMTGKRPVHLALNGHERVDGKAVLNKQIRCINLVKRGMLVLSPEWLAMGQLRTDGWDHDRAKQLDLCGSSGLAPFFLAMQRGLDVLLSLEQADPTRVAVSGESGGGWQSIFLGALDPRVTLVNPVAGYSGLRDGVWSGDVGDSEQLPCDLGLIADYTHLTAMLAPRPTLLTYCAKDQCCFVAAHALPSLLDAAGPVFRLFDREPNLRWHVNHDPGTHNFDKDNRQALYRIIGDHFFPGDSDYSADEIACDRELQSREALTVEMPAENGDFHTLALSLSKSFPRDPSLPRDATAARQWREDRRTELRRLVRPHETPLKAIAAGSDQGQAVRANYWWLRIGSDWTVPVAELRRVVAEQAPRATAILVTDAGRRAATAQAERLLANGYRVLAVDPFAVGESAVDPKLLPPRYRNEYVLGVESVGERALGIQASQLVALARWSHAERPDEPITLVADGPRASLQVLVAAILEERAIVGLELHGSLASLKEVIEQNWTASKQPVELFTFGLLEAFDIKQLAALVAPRPVMFHNATPRMKQELDGLKVWYRTLGSEFEPVR